MFNNFTPVRASLWRERVNTILGTLFLSSFALWAALIMFEAQWGMNPIANAFTATITKHTTLP